MPKKKRTTTRKKRESFKKTAKHSVLDVMTPVDALRVLRQLAEQDAAIAQKIDGADEPRQGRLTLRRK